MTDRQPHELLGAAAKADCCPALCDYRPEAIEHHLKVLAEFECRGEDPCQRSATMRYGVDAEGSRGDGPSTMWDVQRAVKELRAAGREVTPVTVARRLCPWSLDECNTPVA